MKRMIFEEERWDVLGCRFVFYL